MLGSVNVTPIAAEIWWPLIPRKKPEPISWCGQTVRWALFAGDSVSLHKAVLCRISLHKPGNVHRRKSTNGLE